MFEGFGSFISVPRLPMAEGMLESYSRLTQVCQCLIKRRYRPCGNFKFPSRLFCDSPGRRQTYSSSIEFA
jgi:hypothetical protein